MPHVCLLTSYAPDEPVAFAPHHPVACAHTQARLAETVTIVANTIPVNGEIERALSSMIARNVELGEFTRQRNAALLNYTYDKCAEKSTTSSRKQFTLADLGGPTVLLVVTSFFSVIVTRLGKMLKRRTEQIKAHIDTDGDGVVTTAELKRAMSRSSTRGSFGGATSKPTDVTTTSATTNPSSDA